MPNLLKKLRKENNALEQQLSQENNKIMAELVCYLRSSSICDYNLEITRKDITGMLLEAQLRKEKFSDVFGNDYRSFCDELIENGIQKTRYKKLLEILHILVFSIGVLYIGEILFSSKLIQIFMTCQFTMFIITGLVIAALCTLGIAICIYYYITKASFQLSIHNRMIQILFIIGLVMGWTVTVLIRVLAGNLTLYSTSCLLSAVFVAIAFAVIKYLNNQYDNKLCSQINGIKS